MSGFANQILTDVGWDAMADALSGKALRFVNLEAGDGTVASDVEMQHMTQLKHKILDFAINSYSDDGQGQVTLIGTISSKNVATGFYFRELGVRATIDGGPSLLYSVSNAGDQADYIPSSAEAAVVIQSIQVVVKIDRAPNVTINVVAGLDVTAQNIGPGSVGPGWFRDKITQILWFKRFVQGTVIQLTETADTIRIDNPGADTAANIGAPSVGPGWFRDKVANILNFRRVTSQTLALVEHPDTVSIDLNVLLYDLDLYVYNGAPNVSPNFSTIQNAVTYLLQFTIPSNRFATIHVKPGVFPNSTSVQNFHPNSNQISIIGDPVLTKTAMNAGTFSGSAGNYSLVINVDNVTGIAVNDYVTMRGAPCRVANGTWKVTAIAGNTLTLNVKTKQTGGFTQAAGSCNGATIIAYPTKVQFTNCLGFLCERAAPHFGMIANMLVQSMDGPKTSINGFHFSTPGKCQLVEVAVISFNYGFCCIGNGIGVLLDRTSCSLNYAGLSIEAGGMFQLVPFSYMSTSGNTNHGFQIITAGIFRETNGGTIEVCGNGQIGLNMQVGGIFNVITINNFRVWQNAGFSGAYLDTNAIMSFINGSFIQNAGRDCLAVRGGVLQGAVSSPVPAVITPPNNTLGSDGGYLSFNPNP